MVEITTASGTEESILEAPAAMVVITAEDIRQRGYTDLAEIIMDLPGFDVILANGTPYILAYQRGYRTPLTQRTLFMIDGQVDNHLYTHEANITRQYPLSNINKIEVLYGPASAVYGANAFLGIINIVTVDGSALEEGEKTIDVNMQAGSYKTRCIDLTTQGNIGEITYAFSGRVFKSDEPDLSDKWGFSSNDWYSNEDVWGPILDFEHEGVKFGEYYDPTDDNAFFGVIGYKNLKLKVNNWVKKEGYGAYYAADRGQNNSFWNRSSRQVYLDYDGDISGKITGHSNLLYRESRIYGIWAEAEPDWNEGMSDYSYISLTEWNSISNSWLFKQNIEATLTENMSILGGIKFERKELTKSYSIPGYWDGCFSPYVPAGSGIGHSTDSIYIQPPPPPADMPTINMIMTEDMGAFVQGIFNAKPFRFHLGLRVDHNSIYGKPVKANFESIYNFIKKSSNPRLSAIYNFADNKAAIKLLYGEAFQEPAPVLLWGGWTGRNANPDLKPEKARNFEFIAIYQMDHLLHDLSLYYGRYENVIKEEAENAGERDIYGLEYKVRYSFPNILPNSPDINGYCYYTFTDVTSSINYNHEIGDWEEGDTDLGDIAPHKINMGIGLPISKYFGLNLNGNYVSERTPYTRNPLRAKGYTIDSYVVLNAVLTYRYKAIDVAFKVKNLLNKEYLHPGGEGANAGNDFTQRSLGYHNSLLPQPDRSFFINVALNF